MEAVPLKTKATIAFPLLIACAACGRQQVEGSLTEIMDLHYQQAAVASTPAQLVARFTRPQGAGEDIVLQITANLAGLAPGTSRFDLAETMPDNTQRGVVSRNVLNDPRTTFPAIARGALNLSGTLATGQRVSGSFSVTFVEGIQFASGRTAFASFGAIVQ